MIDRVQSTEAQEAPEIPMVGERYPLSRYFSIASLAGIAIVVVALSFFYRHIAISALIDHETRSNEALAQAFLHTVWPAYAEFVESTLAAEQSDELPARAEVARFRTDVVRAMHDLNVVKVKVYNLNGVTVFSTTMREIGEDKSSNAGFIGAKNGLVTSELVFRQRFSAFEGVMVDRNLLSSYLPVRLTRDGPVEAVFEMYSDVTGFVQRLQLTQWQIVGGVLLCLLMLYVFLYVIVRRADLVLQNHADRHKHDRARMRYQADHDALTGLLNRNGFSQRLDEYIERAELSGRALGLMFVDLDRFKLINDSLGHQAGDHLLKVVAKRLQHHVRDTDVPFRMGGDEFTILMENVASREDAAKVAERLIASITEPVQLDKRELIVSASIGIVIGQPDDLDAERLVKSADLAMYRAKDAGRDTYRFHTDEMDAEASDRLAFDTELRQAVRNSELVLHYQPRVDARSDEVVGVEALLRWEHPQRGLLEPDAFLETLEETGLLVGVGRWILERACTQCQGWREAGLPLRRVSVNISRRQLRSETLVADVTEALDESGLPAHCLELALEEQLLFDSAAQAAELLDELKALGVSIVVDNFGSGYSSLTYLKRFPVDGLELHRGIVAELATSDEDLAITTAIATLTHNLGIRLSAEGVETPAQAEILRAHNCAEMQGSLFGDPAPAQRLWERADAGPQATT